MDLAHPVEHGDEAFIPSRGVIGARRMRDVMLHVMQLFLAIFDLGKPASKQLEDRFSGIDFPVASFRQVAESVMKPVSAVVEGVDEGVDVAHADTGLGSAIANRSRRKRTAVLASVESLLRRGCYDVAVDDKRCRGILPLDDTVLTQIKSRKFVLFERHRVLESTPSNDLHLDSGTCSANSSSYDEPSNRNSRTRAESAENNGLNGYFPDNPQIQGNSTTVPPDRKSVV